MDGSQYDPHAVPATLLRYSKDSMSSVTADMPEIREESFSLPTLRRESTYRFAVSDIDINRHVTTRRYIDLIVDMWPLDYYDTMRPSRFELAFKHEARYDEEAVVIAASHEGSPEVNDVEIRVNSTSCCLARLRFTARD